MDDFQGHSGIQRMGDWGGVVQYGGGDQSMIVMFYMRPVHNPQKSTEAGRQYFDDKIFVRIHPPGERLNIIDREATDVDKRRFPMQWAQFRENAPQISDGTPVDMLFPANPSTSAALKASGVHTIEQCAELSAHAIETIGMGAQSWVNSAKRYLEVANKGVKASQLKAALDEKDREITTLKHKIDLLEASLGEIRQNQTKSLTLADVQQMLSNQGGGGKRGVFVPDPNKNFDAQSAQINATSPSNDIAKEKAKVAKRARPKLTT
jgi:hypothetical protein